MSAIYFTLGTAELRGGESGEAGQGRDAQPCSQVLADLALVSRMLSGGFPSRVTHGWDISHQFLPQCLFFPDSRGFN